MDVHLEDIAIGEPPGRGRLNPLDKIAAAIEKPQPRRTEEVLEHAGGEEIALERPDVDRDRSNRLVGVEENESPSLVRELRDTGDVDSAPVAKADVCDRHERGLLVDRGVEPLERDRRVRLGGNVDDAGAAPFLGVPDLADRGEFEIADHHLVAAGLEAESARECADTGGHGRGDSNLVL